MRFYTKKVKYIENILTLSRTDKDAKILAASQSEGSILNGKECIKNFS